MTSLRATGRSSEEEYGVLRDQYAMHVKHATDDEIARVLSAMHCIAGV